MMAQQTDQNPGGTNTEFRRMISSVLFPLLLVTLMWAIHLLSVIYGTDISGYGIVPRTWKGLSGILSSPFIHADFAHLSANSLPFLVCLSLIFYLYRQVAWPVFITVYLCTGAAVWIIGANGSHIGASGLVYGFVSFVFFSGLIRRNLRLMAVSMMIVFLYGGTIWGIFPDFFPEKNISWESHLFGGLTGLILALVYRHRGIQREKWSWEDEPEPEAAWPEVSDSESASHTGLPGKGTDKPEP